MAATWPQTIQQLHALFESEGVVDACGHQAPETLLLGKQTQTPLLESSEAVRLESSCPPAPPPPAAAWRLAASRIAPGLALGWARSFHKVLYSPRNSGRTYHLEYWKSAAFFCAKFCCK